MSRQMKDSGIPWIGQVPEMWTVAPIRSVIKEITTKNILGKETTALQFRYGTIVEKANFEAEGDDYVARTIRNYTIIYPGVLVLNGLNLNYDFVTKRVALSRLKGVITSAYMTIMPIDTHALLPEFLEYLFKCYDAKMAFHGMGEGVRKILNFNELKHQPIIYPSHDEQKQIVAVLDKKCTEVEGLSSNIQKQIEALEQYKRAVITETVTKGLNPSVPMKDSGIPWIGKIPQHWNMLKIKYIAKSNQKSLSEKTNPDYQINYIDIGSVSERKGIETYEEIQFSKAPSRARRIVKSGDCIVSTVRTYLKAIAFIDAQFDNYVVSTGFSVLTPMKQFLVNKYLFFLLKNHPLISAISAYSTGVNYPAISDSVLVNLKMPIPPKNEQQSIANYLDEKCSKIDAIIQDKQQQLKKLEQYKKATIFEYVTGKKQVPEA